jgi:hypothetical protein
MLPKDKDEVVDPELKASLSSALLAPERNLTVPGRCMARQTCAL